MGKTIKLGSFTGAFYIQLEGNEKIDRKPVLLGDRDIKPGEYAQKLGEKETTSFSMKDGWYLRYAGRYENYLLFSTNTNDEDEDHNIYYCFIYVDNETLLIPNNKGDRDLRIKTVEILKSVPLKIINKTKQLNLFDFIGVEGRYI